MADLTLIDDFQNFTKTFWRIADKGGEMVPFALKRGQKLIDDEYMRQITGRGWVRINVLKCRQPGVTTYCTARAQHFVQYHFNRTALTLAHEQKLPEVWLRRCKRLLAMTPEAFRPHEGGTPRNEIWFDKISSRYYVGSVQGGFPGMGDTIHFLHLSEVGSWDKSPVMMDPDKILSDLKPALPTGTYRKGTVQIRESTGRVKGDWWYKNWQQGKETKNEFTNIFLPWFIVEEYRDEEMVSDILSLTPYEQDLIRVGKQFSLDIDKAQIAWRRHEIQQDPWFGDDETWSSFFPSTEDEAFLSPGLSVFTSSQIKEARKSVRDHVWEGDLVVDRNPTRYRLDGGRGGNLLIWEHPDERYHYVLGADCRWGTKDTSDWDVAYVQCLETNKVCARLRGRFDLGLWGRLIASLGYYYNTCPLAPERNALAATALMPLLLGNVSDWRYPNIWIRSTDTSIRPRVQDYGWLTDANTKGDIIAFAKHGTLEGSYDWADRLAVDEAESWIHDEKAGNPTAPEGSFDDCLMARMITAYVAHKARWTTDLYVEPTPAVYTFTTLSERIKEHINEGVEVEA